MKAQTEKLHYDADKECCSEPCLGDFFPDFLHLETNRLNKGRLFSVLLESSGIGIPRRAVILDIEALNECRHSLHFDLCLKLFAESAQKTGCCGGGEGCCG